MVRRKKGVPPVGAVPVVTATTAPAGPVWQSPRATGAAQENRAAPSADAKKPLYTRAVDALASAGVERPSDALISSLIVAQAIDRLGSRIIEAALVGRRAS
jgi:hypothetical protein